MESRVKATIMFSDWLKEEGVSEAVLIVVVCAADA